MHSRRTEIQQRLASFHERFWLHGYLFAAIPAWLISAAWCYSLRSSMADILSHCVMHVFTVVTLMLIVGLVIYRFRRNATTRPQWKRRLILLAIPACLLFYAARPWELFPLRSNASKPGTTKILMWNVFVMNSQYAELEAMIRKHDPDIVALIECNRDLQEDLQGLNSRYANEFWNNKWGSQSTVVLTKFSEATVQARDFHGMELVQVACRPPGSHKLHQLYFLHTLSPWWPGDRVHVRNKQLQTLANEIGNNVTEPVIVMGDFNTSPWSRIFTKILSDGKLIDTRAYRGYFSSWPSFFYELGIPIDHALVNDKVKVIRREVLSDGIGSDHRPILLEIE